MGRRASSPIQRKGPPLAPQEMAFPARSGTANSEPVAEDWGPKSSNRKAQESFDPQVWQKSATALGVEIGQCPNGGGLISRTECDAFFDSTAAASSRSPTFSPAGREISLQDTQRRELSQVPPEIAKPAFFACFAQFFAFPVRSFSCRPGQALGTATPRRRAIHSAPSAGSITSARAATCG